MQRYQITALRPLEITVTFAGSENPQVLKMDEGERRGGVQIVHRVVQADGSMHVDIVAHPADVGMSLTLSDLLEIERLPSWRRVDGRSEEDEGLR